MNCKTWITIPCFWYRIFLVGWINLLLILCFFISPRWCQYGLFERDQQKCSQMYPVWQRHKELDSTDWWRSGESKRVWHRKTHWQTTGVYNWANNVKCWNRVKPLIVSNPEMRTPLNVNTISRSQLYLLHYENVVVVNRSTNHLALKRFKYFAA